MKLTHFSPKPTVDLALWEKVQKINLNLIRERLMLAYGWSESRVDNAITQYRQFLYLLEVEGNKVSPNEEIDMVWHDHILHLQKYLIDCLKTFGRIMFHFPFPSKWEIENLWKCTPSTACNGDDYRPTNEGAVENTLQNQIFKQTFSDMDNPDIAEFETPEKFEVLRNKYFECTDAEVAIELADLA